MEESKKPQEQMKPIDDYTINEYIKEYLEIKGFPNSVECFNAEIKAKFSKESLRQMTNSPPSRSKEGKNPRIYELLSKDVTKTQKERSLETEFKQLFN